MSDQKYTIETEWLKQVDNMISEGADIIDIGAYSSRPGAEHISEETESLRLIKTIDSVRKHFPEILISADTFRASIAEKAIEAGANIINDISGGTLDKKMFEKIAELKVPYILMHMQGTPQTMQEKPRYENIVKDIYTFFEEQLKKLNSLGLTQVIIDPGFGFGKTLENNYALMRSLEDFIPLNKPVLIGISRKSMVTKLLNINKKESINGTTILNLIGLQKGAKIIRVHDVKETKEIITILNFMND